MYTDSLFSVRNETFLSENIKLNVGVKQGDNLSPNLFKIYINDLPDIFNNEDDPVELNNTPLSCLLYADDLILFSTTQKGLHNCLDKLSIYCSSCWYLIRRC